MSDFTLLSTGELQLRSLYGFMFQLGYVPGETKTGKPIFETMGPKNAPNNLISFNTAVRMHNSTPEDMIQAGMHLAFGNTNLGTAFTPLAVHCASVNRLVQKVKMHRTKHGEIRVLSQMVKPTVLSAGLFPEVESAE